MFCVVVVVILFKLGKIMSKILREGLRLKWHDSFKWVGYQRERSPTSAN